MVDFPEYWEEKYKNDITPWDTGGETKIFKDLLTEEKLVKKGKLLVPGCGRGYDAILAAELGYEVTGLDFSETAIKEAMKLSESKGVSVNFLQQDFFSLESKNEFDLVFDYTSYCAINPKRRREYFIKLTEILKPCGKLIIILFPIDQREGGPPFSIDVPEFYKLFREGFYLEFSSRRIDSIKPRKGKEILQVYIRKD
jgi:methyl halide transferase